MSPIRVLIADDHAILRSGLQLLLEQQADIQVVGAADCWGDAARLLQELQPDVATIDLSMPGGNAFEQIANLRSLAANTKLIVLTMHEELSCFRAAIASGADGYVLKRSADIELIAAIRCVRAGKLYANMELEESRQSFEPSHLPTSESSSTAGLSAREQQVLQSVAQGMTNREIAEELFLSIKTVESYRSRLMQKLGVSTRAELVRYAIASGILTSH